MNSETKDNNFRNNFYQQEQHEKDSRKYILKDVRNYLKKVYLVVLLGLCFTTLSTFCFCLIEKHFFLQPWLFISALILSFISFFCVLFLPKSKLKTRLFFYLIYSSLFGLDISIFIVFFELNSKMFISALVTTLLIFILSTIASFFIKRKALFYLATVIFSLCIVCLFALITSIIMNDEKTTIIISSLLIIVYSLMIVYDTRLIIEGRIEGEEDLISDSLKIFSSLIYLFIQLLRIYTYLEKD